MSINQFILRNVKKNIKSYYLYVFALIFSVVLYFSFVTLQYDPSMDATKGSIKGAASMKTSSILLVGIVSVFLLYANSIFIKNRSKEIGLFQLIGMTKVKIFRILTLENLILYFASLVIGILIGFSLSKIILMILIKITQVEAIATMQFSTQALWQTVIVFAVIYLFIMLMNYFFISRHNIMSLFRVTSSTEETVKKVSFLEMLIGIMGILLIALGYFISTKLFGGAFTSAQELFLAMIFILASVIIGTYLFYKGSVRFIFYVIRKKKGGYLNISEVLSLSSIMFRMKSNALLLTIITTVSALAIGLLSLSYITYYSSEASAKNNVAADFAITNEEDGERFTLALEANSIEYSKRKIDVLQIEANLENIMETKMDDFAFNPKLMLVPVVSDHAVDHIDVAIGETVFSGTNDLIQKVLSMKDEGSIEWIGQNEVIPHRYVGLEKEAILSWYFTGGGLPVAIVDEQVFQQLANDSKPDLQKETSIYIGIDIEDAAHLERANELFIDMFSGIRSYDSRILMSSEQRMNMGLIMFIVGFLGLTFLITSGCILYFKQMGECEEEKPNYTILRKLGFTKDDLLRGIITKQLFNFGIPLIIGLLHSYFAVQSGWFLFGTELWTPMFIVMAFYTGLYSIFAILSVAYYKKIISESLGYR